jgi:hypothetical protein
VSPCVRLEYLAPQVILIGSRHACLRRRVSPPIHYTIIAIALGDSLNDLVDRARDNPNAVLYGTFYTYKPN